MTSNLDAFNSLTFRNLAAAHAARQAEWCPDQKPDLSFRGCEMAGEVGEACNIIKKLERERHGWNGSRATIDQLADELADVIHTATLVAYTAGIPLEQAVIRKFNATSDANDLCTKLPMPDTDTTWAEVMEITQKIVTQVGNPNSGKTAVISSIDAHKMIKMLFKLKTTLLEANSHTQIAEATTAEPLFYYRPLNDGLYEGPHHSSSCQGKMLRDIMPGQWKPLYAAPHQSAPAEHGDIRHVTASIFKQFEAFLSSGVDTSFLSCYGEDVLGRLIADAILPRLQSSDDWTVDDTDCASKILLQLGIYSDPSKEPGADQRRDKIAAIIRGYVDAIHECCNPPAATALPCPTHPKK